MPKVSIIIPTHNRCGLLPRAIESAWLAGGDIEIIVVDDASTDATPAVCERFSQVKVVRLTQNVGLAAARNAGIQKSTGDYIALLDDDDVRLANSLPPQVSVLEANPGAALAYGPVLLGDTEKCESTGVLTPQCTPSGDLFWRLLRSNFIPAISVVIRRQPLFDVGLFDQRLRQVEDWDLWLRLGSRHPFVAVSDPVAIYRCFQRDSGQLSSNTARMALSAAKVQWAALRLSRAKLDAPRASRIREVFLKEQRFTLMQTTIEALLVGSHQTVRGNLFAILKLMPLSPLLSREYRELSKLVFLSNRIAPRDLTKRLKALRKHLWNTVTVQIPDCDGVDHKLAPQNVTGSR